MTENGGAEGESELAAVADELYALAPEEFIAARAERGAAARSRGDTALAAAILRFRKPSAAAWLVNMLARHRADRLAGLIRLGGSLRRAQEELDAGAMRELSRQRHEQLRTLATEARALAEQLGRAASDVVVDDVTQTLQAAITDASAAAAVGSGRLTRALPSTGIEPDELADAVAVPAAVRTPPPDEEPARAPGLKQSRRDRDRDRDRDRNRELDEARRNVDDAEHEAEEAEAHLDAIDRRARDLSTRRRRLQAELEELRGRVDDVEEALTGVREEDGRLERDRRTASRAAEEAQRRAAQARARLQRLT